MQSGQEGYCSCKMRNSVRKEARTARHSNASPTSSYLEGHHDAHVHSTLAKNCFKKIRAGFETSPIKCSYSDMARAHCWQPLACLDADPRRTESSKGAAMQWGRSLPRCVSRAMLRFARRSAVRCLPATSSRQPWRNDTCTNCLHELKAPRQASTASSRTDDVAPGSTHVAARDADKQTPGSQTLRMHAYEAQQDLSLPTCI